MTFVIGDSMDKVYIDNNKSLINSKHYLSLSLLIMWEVLDYVNVKIN